MADVRALLREPPSAVARRPPAWLRRATRPARSSGRKLTAGLIDCIERRVRHQPNDASGRLRVCVVHLGWGKQASASRDRLRSVLSTWSAIHDVRFIAVDNRKCSGSPTTIGRWTVVPGDNSAREFTGWQAGVAHARQQGSTDVWMFVNDRWDAYGAVSPFLADPHLPDVIHSIGGLCGHVDRFPISTNVLGHSTSAWVTTNVFLLANAAYERLGSLVSVDNESLSTVLAADFHSNAGPQWDYSRIDKAFAAAIEDWLTGQRRHLDSAWYRAAPLNQENWPEFRAKALSILNEHLLTARSLQVAVPVLPIETAAQLARFGLQHPVVVRLLGQYASDPASTLDDGPLRRLRRAVRAWGTTPIQIPAATPHIQ